ncbi:transcription factor bHLH144-like [Dioscorea cayenensis subsp. rotundata]|uniref:Transcription factor bHLH144-like n=1 Tax=Dioscorea cayennensis subsp. rotundata TaxID=55577 RepID=A0AB40B448_DIOCR|nr:transcription factor bHLH144-like [Dioscorea cayenensis subsp. rotundata]XP_039121548.1 transcription factor bHLH144-like [Dioscorea cayenensis subsp. rotundata]
MQSDPRFLTGNSSPTDPYEVGGYTHLGDHGTYGTYVAPPFSPAVPGRMHDFPGPMMNGFEFQPLETCPKNFIIFDQSDNKGRVMFHPALAQKFSYPSFDIHPTLAHNHGQNLEKVNEIRGKLSSSLKEDTEEIDALLSSEEEEEEEEEEDEDEEDDVISTGRTPSNWGYNSHYSSSSTEGSKSRKAKSSSSAHNSFSSSASSSDRKRERMRKMVKALRGIIPGGDHLDTPAVLDEAVRYLKSLKMEAKKLGIQNLEE